MYGQCITHEIVLLEFIFTQIQDLGKIRLLTRSLLNPWSYLVVISWYSCLSSLVIISLLSWFITQVLLQEKVCFRSRYYFLPTGSSLGTWSPSTTFCWTGSPPRPWHGPFSGLTEHVKWQEQVEKTFSPRPEPKPRSGWLGVHRILLNIYPNFPDLNLIPREGTGQGLVWEAAVQAKPRFQPLTLVSAYSERGHSYNRCCKKYKPVSKQKLYIEMLEKI